MKHIYRGRECLVLLSILLLFPMYSFTQNEFSGDVRWEDGQPYLLPADLIVKMIDPSNGNGLGTFKIPIENGSINDDNAFIFINPLIGAEYHFSVKADLDARTGITVLDILRLQKHLLNIQPFDNALQVYAGDVNGSSSISTLDLVQIRKVILGLSSGWPNKENITFFHRTGPQAPAIGSTLNSVIIYDADELPSNLVLNFWAVKTGDVVR